MLNGQRPEIVAFGPDALKGLRALFKDSTPENFLPERILGMKVVRMLSSGIAVYGR
jgi:hypothetical protein